MAPFNVLSRATASGGTVGCPSKIGRMSASASAFSGAVFSSRACMCPPRPLANVPYCTCRLARAFLSLSFLEAPLHFDQVGIGVPVPTQLILTARFRDAEPDPGGNRRRRLGDRIESLLSHQSVP